MYVIKRSIYSTSISCTTKDQLIVVYCAIVLLNLLSVRRERQHQITDLSVIMIIIIHRYYNTEDYHKSVPVNA